ncbi:MAG: helix-turn-helix domain-containing protein [Halanaerobiales bacterium]
MAKTYTDKKRKVIVEKIEETYNSSDQITIKEACTACGISDATYYNWRHRYDN